MFEWDKNKAGENKSKHGISFADTFSVFEDPNAVTLDDDRWDEQRYITNWNGCILSYTCGCLYMARG